MVWRRGKQLLFQVFVEIFIVEINKDSIKPDKLEKLGWLLKQTDPQKMNRYYLLQIRQNVQIGPVFVVKKVTAATKGKGLKNQLHGQLKVRTQATNHSISAQNFQTPSNKKLVKDVFAKFDPGFSSSKGQIEKISSSRSKESAFRVLIINQMVDELEPICSSLSQVKWNLVLDLDGRSAECGVLHHMKQNLEQLLDLIVANNLDLNKDAVKTLNLKQVQKTVASLYVLLSGDASIPVKRPEVFPETDLRSVIKELFERIETVRPLEVYVAINSHLDLQEMSKAAKCVMGVWHETCTSQEYSFYGLFTHQRLKDVFAMHMGTDIKAESSDWIEAVAPLGQIDSFFHQMKAQSSTSSFQDIVIPSSGSGSPGFVISKSNLHRIEKQFVLYHNNVGSDIWKKEDAENTIYDYLRGFEATPRLFYAENYIKKTHAYRNIMDDLLLRLWKKLYSSEPEKSVPDQFRPATNGTAASSQWNSSSTRKKRDLHDIVVLQHEPSAGGTTCGRKALWELKNEFPCMELLPWSKDSFSEIEDAVRLVYFGSRKPLCILIDTSTVSGNTKLHDVQDLLRQIKSISENDDLVEAVVLFIQCNTYGRTGEAINVVSLTTKLGRREEEDFNALYDRVASRLKRTPVKTVSLYGLCQFNRKYGRLDAELCSIKESGGAIDKRVLLLSAVTLSYSGLSFPLTLVAKVLDLPSGCKDPEKILLCLNSARNLLLVESTEIDENRANGVRPPTTFVADNIIEMIFGKSSALRQYVSMILELLDESCPMRNVIDFLITPIFIQRNVSFSSDGERGRKERFSEFVRDLLSSSASDNAAEEVEMILKDMVSHFGHTMPHFQAMFARYLAYKVGNIDRALLEMKEVVRVGKDRPFASTCCNDNLLLTTAGHLISIKVSTLATADVPGPAAIEIAQPLMKDAIAILTRAQQAQTNVYPFVIESRLRYYYVKLYFYKMFDKNRARLSEALQRHPDNLLTASVGEIWRKLGDLEHLLHIKPLDGYEEQETTAAISIIKVQVLRLLVDLAGRPINRLIHEGKRNIDVARFCVSYLLSPEGQAEGGDVFDLREDNRNRKRFENLSQSQLVMVIDLLVEHLSCGLDRESFRHAILAQIYLHKHDIPPRMQSMSIGNASLCIRFAEQWVNDFKADYRGWYYLAVLHLSMAFVQSADQAQSGIYNLNRSHLDQFWDAYDRCQQLLQPNNQQSSHRPGRSEMNFVVAKKQKPLQVLVPRDRGRDVFHDLWYQKLILIFHGKCKELRRPRFLICEELCTKKHPEAKVQIPMREFKRHQIESRGRPLYSFALRTTPRGLYVEQITKLDGTPVVGQEGSPD